MSCQNLGDFLTNSSGHQCCQMVRFQTKNLNNFQGLRSENVDIFNSHLDYFMTIWDIL
jgi:hypothetical protein